VRLIVDDFGAGYSSLPALRELMVDGLKLDRAFVQALVAEDGVDDDGAMVGAVLSMAGALDAHVTAEGWKPGRRSRASATMAAITPRATCSPGRARRSTSRDAPPRPGARAVRGLAGGRWGGEVVPGLVEL